MNKKGITILELLLSISLVSIIILLLLQVIISLSDINNDKTYASSDEIQRTEIIKEIEEDFLSKKLNGVSIKENENDTTLTFLYDDGTKENLKIEKKSLTYHDTYSLKSENATYDLCINYKIKELENDYYLLKIEIPVLIQEHNTTKDDDIILSFLGLKNEFSNYPPSFTCSKK